MPRQRQLDGLRGVAILMVMMLHSLLLPIGWMGVDIFFALSGFLITRILLGSKCDPYYWKSFYSKRAGRILPPLLLLFVVVLMIAGHKTWLGMLGYVLFLGDYVNTSTYAIAILVPLWSLAIEEHFYIVWPIAVRSLSRLRLAQIMAAVLIVEPILRAIFTPLVADVRIIRYFTPFRLDAIAAGSLLALVMGHQRGVALLKRVSLTLVAAAVASYSILWALLGEVFTPGSLVFNSIGYSLVAIFSFGVVAHALLHNNGRMARWLSCRLLVFLGEISYGLYLFHQIIRGATKAFFGIGYGHAFEAQERWLFLPDVLISVLVCAFLFRFYETPLIRWSKRKAEESYKKVEVNMAYN